VRWTVLAFLVSGVAAMAAYLGLRSPERPSVVVITIDTLRPDAIGDSTPAMQRFLEQARNHRGARTVAPLTVPAHASLLTGLRPARHGVHDNVAAPIPRRTKRGWTLLAEEFRDAGYATAAFYASGVLAADTGLDAGFDRYQGPPNDGTSRSFPAERQADAALAWLSERDGDRPFFLWVHFFDPHAPYVPFAGDDRRRGTRAHDPERELYLGEVRRVDAAVERLLDAIGPEAVVVLASDHGESLGEHGEQTHGILCYGATVDALLAVRGPGFEAEDDPAPRSLCDLAPTLRRRCGLPARPGDGRPLRGPPAGVVVSECLYTYRVHGWAQCFAASDGRYTLVESGPRLELFDRRADPRERRPLDRHDVPEFEKLDRALLALRSTDAGPGREHDLRRAPIAYAAARRPFTAYLPRRENAALPDPRPLAKAWMRFTTLPETISFYLSRRDVEGLRGMVPTLRSFAEQMEESPVAYQYLGAVLYELGNLTGDRDAYAAAAGAQCRAIERGHVLPDAFRAAAGYAHLSRYPAAFERVLELAAATRLVPDAACYEEMLLAAAAFGLDADPRLLRLRAPTGTR